MEVNPSNPLEHLIVLYYNKLNNISDHDYGYIIGSLKYLLEPRYNCNSPDKYIHNGRAYSQTQIDNDRALKGCFKPLKSKANMHRHSNLFFSLCPCNFYDLKIHTLLKLNEYYQQFKTLPKEYIYPKDKVFNKTMQALKIVNNFLEERKLQEMKKQQEQAKRGLK